MAWVQGTGTRKAGREAAQLTRNMRGDPAKAGQLDGLAGRAPSSRAEMRDPDLDNGGKSNQVAVSERRDGFFEAEASTRIEHAFGMVKDGKV